MDPYDRTLPLGIVLTTSYTRLWKTVGGLPMILREMMIYRYEERDLPLSLLRDLPHHRSNIRRSVGNRTDGRVSAGARPPCLGVVMIDALLALFSPHARYLLTLLINAAPFPLSSPFSRFFFWSSIFHNFVREFS